MGMFKEPVVFLDIETNGSHIERSQIIEIGAIRVEDGEIVETFKSFVNPGSPIPFWITNLTGITENDLAGAPYFDEIAHELHRMLEGAIFIAHNVRFDYSYIKRQLKAVGYDYRPKLLCTVRLSRALYPYVQGHSLEKVIARHHIPVAARHRAFDDAKAIFDFTNLAYAEHGDELFQAAVSKQMKSRSLPPNLDESFMESVPDTPGVYIFKDDKDVPIYIGKSITLKTRILSHFSQSTKLNNEMKLSSKTHKLEFIPTSNELEALLLESKLVKEMLPVYNKKLRRIKSHFVLLRSINQDGYATISVADKDLAKEEDLNNIYGMFGSKVKAVAALESHRKAYQLCPKLLGLEKTAHSCFQYQLNRCKGACVGKEPAASYNLRVELALQKSKVESWPFKSAVAIGDGQGDYLVVDHWIIQGYLRQVQDQEPEFDAIERTFDVDVYRILRSFIKKRPTGMNIISYTMAT